MSVYVHGSMGLLVVCGVILPIDSLSSSTTFIAIILLITVLESSVTCRNQDLVLCMSLCAYITSTSSIYSYA